MQIITRPALNLRQRQDFAPIGHLRNDLGGQGFIAAMLQQIPAQHHRCQIGLDRQRAADRLHHNHALHRPAAEPALLLGKRQGQNPRLGIFRPNLRIKPARQPHISLALLKIPVSPIQKLAEALLQQSLILVQIEIHVLSPTPRRIEYALRNPESPWR